ncbi:MAG TPA: SBBP repeat-containing protein [Acidimicrobiales bacterium]|nr:SBBP repeat-containing protein [Acidimicrobiales bacterium]
MTLAHDVGPCPGGGIIITTNGVTLNLGGRKIIGDGNATEMNAGIRIAAGVSNVTITDTTGANNLVTGFNAGIMIEGNNNMVANVNVIGNVGSLLSDYGHGIGVDGSTANQAHTNTITNNKVVGNGPYAGIYLIGDSDSNTITSNLISANVVPDDTPLQAHGIRLEPLAGADNAPDNNTITSNTVTENGTDGIAVMAVTGTEGPTGNTIGSNTVEANRRDGIRLFARPASGTHDCPGAAGDHCSTDTSGNTISNNTVCANLADGIAVYGHGNTIDNNQSGNNEAKVNPGVTPSLPAVCVQNGVLGAVGFDLHDSHPCPPANTWTNHTAPTLPPPPPLGTLPPLPARDYTTSSPTNIQGAGACPGGGGSVDPVPPYSSFLGSALYDDARAVAVSADGKTATVTGQTCATNTSFPSTTVTGADNSANGGCDAFVATFNTGLSGTSSLKYATLLGGVGADLGNGVAVDSSGNTYVTGQTCATGAAGTFTATGGYDTTTTVGCDAFVAKLNPTLSTVSSSTFLGGTGTDAGNGIALDSSGNAYVAGQTCASGATAFPTTAGAYDASANGSCDAFVSKLSSSLASLDYSSFQGGPGTDIGSGIAVGTIAGTTTVSAYITGQTCSTGAAGTFTATGGAYDQTTAPNECDGFVSKFNPAWSGTSSLAYATFLGGDANGDDLNPLDGDGYLLPESPPWQVPAVPPATNSPTNVCINIGEVCNPDIPYAGSPRAAAGADTGTGIDVDSEGRAYVTGSTFADNFPTTSGAYQTKRKAGNCGQTRDGRSSTQPWRTPGDFQLFYLQKLPCSDAFVTKLNAAGSTLDYSTYLGGSDHDAAKGIAVNDDGNAYVTGYTYSGSRRVVLTSTSAYDGSCEDGGCVHEPFPTEGGGDTTCGTDTASPADGRPFDGTCNSYTFEETRPETPTATPCKASQAAYCEEHTIYIPDAFFTKVNTSGSGLVYSAFLGGSSDDWGAGVGVGNAGTATVTGRTLSSNFPTSSSAYDGTYNMTGDAFVTRYTG